jgi:chorismate mutase
MKPEERRILENIRDYQKFQKDSIADAMAAMVEQGKQSEQVANAVLEMTSRLGQVFDAVAELNERLGRYLTDQAREKATVKNLQSEVREIRSRVG